MYCIPLWIIGLFVWMIGLPGGLKIAGIRGLAVSGVAGSVMIFANAFLPSLCLPL